MGFTFIRLPVHDPDAATISLPTRDARTEVFIRVGDTLVVLLFVLVFIRIRIRIAPAPELLDKAFSFVVVGQLLKGFPLFVRDDVSNVFIEPVFVCLFQLRLKVARLVGWVLGVLGKGDSAGTYQEAYCDGQTESYFLVKHSETPMKAKRIHTTRK